MKEIIQTAQVLKIKFYSMSSGKLNQHKMKSYVKKKEEELENEVVASGEISEND